MADFEAAEEEFQEEVAEWSKLIEADLERQMSVARARGTAAEIERIRIETKQFADGKFVPGSAPAGLRRKLPNLARQLDKAAERAVEDLLTAGRDADAEQVKSRTNVSLRMARLTAVRDQLVGRWALVSAEKPNYYTFRGDEFCHTTAKDLTRPWVINLKDGYVTVTSENGYQDNLHLPLNPRGTEGHNNRGNQQRFIKVR